MTQNRGFTLVEMLVVLAIIAVVTVITISGQSSFNRSLLLTDTAYSLALSLRQVQSMGLSSRSYNGIQDIGYGVRVAAGSPITSYLVFADTHKTSPSPLSTCPVGIAGSPDEKPGNCVYTASDQTVQRYEFSRGFTIKRFCGRTTGGSPQTYCSDDGSAPLTAVDIVFVRSNTTEAIITGQRSGSVALSSAQIYIQSPDTQVTRGVCVSQIGQVSVATSTCP